MIRIDNVSHRIGSAPILQGIDLTLPPNSVTALIGPNGAGKSTLLNLIGRLIPLQEGRISVDGQDVTTTPSRQLAKVMAILGQTNHAGSRLRVRELVAFGRWPHHLGRARPDDHAAVQAALAQFDLAGLAERFLDEISGGQRQRAFLAMCIAQDTDWLLLDEPLNNLDMAHARALMARLHALRTAGRGIVVVVHEVNYAAAWADHVVALKAGRVVTAGTPQQVLTPGVLGQLYDMEIRVTELDGRPLVLHHV